MEKLAKLKSELSRSCSSSRNGTPNKSSAISTSHPPSPLLESTPIVTKSDEDKTAGVHISSYDQHQVQSVEKKTNEEAIQPPHSVAPLQTAKKAYLFEDARYIPSLADTKAAVADEINLFLLDYLSKQQKEIDELKRTQDTINDLLFLQRRDLTSVAPKEPSVDAIFLNQYVPVDSNIYTVKEFHDTAEAYSEDSMPSASQLLTEVLPEDTDNETITPPVLPIDEDVIAIEVPDPVAEMPFEDKSHGIYSVEPLHNRDELEINAGKYDWPTQHCRRPSGTDSVLSALTSSTGVSSAPPLPTCHSGQRDTVVVSEMKVMPTPPQQLQRLRFQSFLEAAQGYSPNYKFNNKFNFSPNFNTSNFAANRELEEMVCKVFSLHLIRMVQIIYYRLFSWVQKSINAN